MTYVRDQARFTVLDSIPADVWQEAQEERVTPSAPIVTDPECYLCIVGDEPADYYGQFSACAYTLAGHRTSHCEVGDIYLATRCTPAPESTAREIIADYLRFMAYVECMTNPDENAAELLEDVADRIETGRE